MSMVEVVSHARNVVQCLKELSSLKDPQFIVLNVRENVRLIMSIFSSFDLH